MFHTALSVQTPPPPRIPRAFGIFIQVYGCSFERLGATKNCTLSVHLDCFSLILEGFRGWDQQNNTKHLNNGIITPPGLDDVILERSLTSLSAPAAMLGQECTVLLWKLNTCVWRRNACRITPINSYHPGYQLISHLVKNIKNTMSFDLKRLNSESLWMNFDLSSAVKNGGTNHFKLERAPVSYLEEKQQRFSQSALFFWKVMCSDLLKACLILIRSFPGVFCVWAHLRRGYQLPLLT